MKRLLVALLLLSSLCHGQQRFFSGQQSNSTLGRQNLILTADGESGTLPSPFNTYGASDPSGVASISRSSTTSAFGTQSYKFIVNKSDAEFASGVRAELSTLGNGAGTYPYDRKIGFSVYFPSSGWTFETNTVLYNIIQQFHDDGSGAETEQKSPFEFCLAGNKFSFTQRYNATETVGSVTEILANDNLANLSGSNPTLSNNTWYDVVIHTRFEDPDASNANANNGRAEIWVKQHISPTWIKIADYTGKMGYHHSKAPYLKIGNYCWVWNSGNLACCGNFTLTTSKTHYVDNIRYGNAASTFTDVDPGTP